MEVNILTALPLTCMCVCVQMCACKSVCVLTCGSQRVCVYSLLFVDFTAIYIYSQSTFFYPDKSVYSAPHNKCHNITLYVSCMYATLGCLTCHCEQVKCKCVCTVCMHYTKVQQGLRLLGSIGGMGVS